MNASIPFSVTGMFERSEFFGSATVGERGQIVLPVQLRKKFGIGAGDKLIVIGLCGRECAASGRVMLLKVDVLNDLIRRMESRQRAIKELIDEGEGPKRKGSDRRKAGRWKTSR